MKKKIPQEDLQGCKLFLDLLHFRQRVAEALIKNRQSLISRKRGRPFSDPSHPVNTPTSTRGRRPHSSAEIRPASEVHYNTVDHLPEYDNKQEATNCKKPECKGSVSSWAYPWVLWRGGGWGRGLLPSPENCMFYNYAPFTRSDLKNSGLAPQARS
ncbi:hypothetical protein EVAR_21978_1 [Eumeta japonica]|uniref:Uncharacterized protein n=1 Tax=Eumeta variegata TaxID=151549 RepID=A0A4C1VWH4_EUMVA|nr:hypothetical protein EVAR_21978_1 [Eumeta japonica]